MEWLQNNWLWLALAVGFVAMHMFGHGGHQHGGRSRNDRPDPTDTNDATGVPGAEHAHLRGTATPTDGISDPALRILPAHAGHAAEPTPADGKRHRHRC